jgi:hypothetical protein
MKTGSRLKFPRGSGSSEDLNAHPVGIRIQGAPPKNGIRINLSVFHCKSKR